MDEQTKIYVLDLIISVLREHEKKLDELVNKLEKLVDASDPHGEMVVRRRYYDVI